MTTAWSRCTRRRRRAVPGGERFLGGSSSRQNSFHTTGAAPASHQANNTTKPRTRRATGLDGARTTQHERAKGTRWASRAKAAGSPARAARRPRKARGEEPQNAKLASDMRAQQHLELTQSGGFEEWAALAELRHGLDEAARSARSSAPGGYAPVCARPARIASGPRRIAGGGRLRARERPDQRCLHALVRAPGMGLA